MAGRHRHWHRAWALDAPGRTATHTSGLIVHYTPIQDLPDRLSRIAGVCGAAGRLWLVEPTPQTLADWLAAPPVPEVNITRRLGRLMREAGELWSYHHDR
jgi:hypothetical protein